MQKVIARATVAVCALSTGIALSILANKYQNQSAPTAGIPAGDLRISPYISRGWKRIDIDGKFAFYVPPTMTPEPPPGDGPGPAGVFVDTELIVSFTYSERLSCKPDPTIIKNMGGHASMLTIGGKTATVQTWQSQSSGHQFSTTLCFPDIGDGQTKLHMGAGGVDATSMNVAKQIFDSIEFR